jgi:hypothetical protein
MMTAAWWLEFRFGISYQCWPVIDFFSLLLDSHLLITRVTITGLHIPFNEKKKTNLGPI